MVSRICIALATFACLLPLRAHAAATAGPCAANAYQVLKSSATYGADARYETLDLYAPDGKNRVPLVVFVHGGGWSHGDKAQYAPLGSTFARCGIALAVIDYPLAPQAHVDAQAQAVARGTRWILDHQGTPSSAVASVFFMGHDAGAELAMLAALNPAMLSAAGLRMSSLMGVIALDGIGYNPSELVAAAAANPAAYRIYFDAFGSDTTAWAHDDCDRYITTTSLRFLVIHGVDDTTAAERESAALVAALQGAHNAVTYLQPEGRDHNGVLVDLVQSADDPTRLAIERFVLGR
jgi:arylformamidase